MKKISRVIAGVMLAAAVCFVWFAMNHPELSWSWGNSVSYILYGIYAVAVVVLLIAPFPEKK